MPSAAAGSGSSVHQFGCAVEGLLVRSTGGGAAVNLPDCPSSPAKSLLIVYDHTFASRGEKRKRSRRPSFAPITGTRLSKIIFAVFFAEKPSGTGNANSTTPKTST